MSIDVLDCISRLFYSSRQKGVDLYVLYLGFRFLGINVVTVFEGQDTIARVNRCFGLLFSICFALLAERNVDL